MQFIKINFPQTLVTLPDFGYPVNVLVLVYRRLLNNLAFQSFEYELT